MALLGLEGALKHYYYYYVDSKPRFDFQLHGLQWCIGGGGGLESTERCCCVVTLLLISGTRTGDVFDRNAIHQHMLPDRCGDFDQYACHTVWHRRWAPSHCLHHQTDVLAPHAPGLHPFWNTHGW
jgi:hypothetical protein